MVAKHLIRRLKSLLVCLVLLTAVPARASTPVSADSFQFIVRSIAAAEQPPRREFATVALLHLAEVYFAEAGLARRQAVEPKPGSSASPRRWSQAVERQAESLLLLHDAVLEGFPVEVAWAPAGSGQAILSVGGQPVVLSHPRPSRQAALEQAIVADFCRRVDCLSLGSQGHGSPRLAPPDSPP